MSPLRNLTTRGRRNLDTVVALSVLGFSVCGIVATALATGHELPGFEVYDQARVDEHKDNTIITAPVSVRSAATTPVPLETFPAPVQALTIAAIRISAPVVPMGLRPDGYMDLPYNPHQVAWYHFTGKPGMGGNAVFSAHVDYINYGPAVFWNLHTLRAGDDIDVRLSDATVIHYTVTESYIVPKEQLDIQRLVAPTDGEMVTLITCAGTFANDDYSHRVVVRAERTSAERGPAS